MRVAEVYRSIQGEGLLAGTESVFVRASGCNLRCWYCDTPYASWSPEGEDLEVAEIIRRVAQLESFHVVLTGGEPMLFAELLPLTEGLRALGRHITIETAGTLYLPVECDLMSLSPKLAGTAPDAARWPHWHARHERTRDQPEVVARLIEQYAYQFKFVVDQPSDCQLVLEYLARYPQLDRRRVLLMPQGVEAAELARRGAWLEAYCRQLDLGFCPRQHIAWFGLARGT